MTGKQRGTDPVDRVLQRLDCVKQVSGGYLARCPAHDDPHPSLSISEGDDRRILLHCWAGCATQDVLAAIGLRFTDLFPEHPRRHGGSCRR